MSHPALLDFDALVAPINESHPCGTSYDSGEDGVLTQLFSELRTLTNVARNYEKQRYLMASGAIEGEQQAESPNWDRIAFLSNEIICKHSKDTRAIVGLIESSARVYSLPGLRDALKASALLIERYQLQLFPETEPGEYPHYCLEFIGKICESELYNLQSAVYQADLFESAPGFSWFSYFAATQLDKQLQKLRDSDEKARLIERSPMTLEKFRVKLAEFRKRSDFKDFEEQVREALAEAIVLDKLLGSLSDNQVGITRLVGDLTELERWYRNLTSEYIEKLPAETVAADNSTDDVVSGDDSGTTGNGSSGNSNAPKGNLASREQALASLLQVAAFFRSTEPHSPLSYALEQAVRWGKMPLPELLRDLVQDSGVLAQVYQRMGIQEKPDNSDG